jgi:hypothetical protein
VNGRTIIRTCSFEIMHSRTGAGEAVEDRAEQQLDLQVAEAAFGLEQAATGAGSAVVEYRLLENLAADLGRWADEQAGVPPLLRSVIVELDGHLDTEILPRARRRVLSAP